MSSTPPPPEPAADASRARGERLLSVRDLVVQFRREEGDYVTAVDGLSYDLHKNETIGIVGESGSGKSVTNLAIMGLLEQPPARLPRGQILYHDKDLLKASPEQLRRLRGNRIAMIFQDPMTSLNPFLRISTQMIEIVRIHNPDVSKAEATRRGVAMLERVGIPGAEDRFRQYPHQFSGGMRQRVMIAMMLLNNPELLIADEPTTALDVTIQAQILDLLKDLQRGLPDGDHADHARPRRRRGHRRQDPRDVLGQDDGVRPDARALQAPLAPVHARPDALDPEPRQEGRSPLQHPRAPAGPRQPPPGLPLRAALHLRAQRVQRLVSGRDRGRPRARRLLLGHRAGAGRGRLGRGLLGQGPSHDPVRRRIVTTAAGASGAVDPRKPLLSLRDFRVHFPIRKGAIFRRTVGTVRAVDGLDLDIYPGETLGLVGESGCGKSTTGRGILQLYEHGIADISGSIHYGGRDLCKLGYANMRAMRRELQIIFQDPYASLNPRMNVGTIVAEPIKVHKLESGAGVMRRVHELLEVVGLSPQMARRYPHEFSGGQRQRIGIARALAVRPKFIVCDEPISALDVSIQAQVMNLMEDLQQQFDLTYLFIAHDLGAVKHISDRIAVMYLGKIAELAPAEEVYHRPLHPYSQALISAVPVADPDLANRPRILLEGDVPSPLKPPPGCRFHTRCRYAQAICREKVPQLVEILPGHRVACHLVENGTLPTENPMEHALRDVRAGVAPAPTPPPRDVSEEVAPQEPPKALEPDVMSGAAEKRVAHLEEPGDGPPGVADEPPPPPAGEGVADAQGDAPKPKPE